MSDEPKTCDNCHANLEKGFFEFEGLICIGDYCSYCLNVENLREIKDEN